MSSSLPRVVGASRWFGTDARLTEIATLAATNPTAALRLAQDVGGHPAITVIPASDGGAPDHYLGIAPAESWDDQATRLVVVTGSQVASAPVGLVRELSVEAAFGSPGTSVAVLRFTADQLEQWSTDRAIRAIARHRLDSAAIALGIGEAFAQKVQQLRGPRYRAEEGTPGFRHDIEVVFGHYYEVGTLLDELIGDAIELSSATAPDSSALDVVGRDLIATLADEWVPLATTFFDVLGARYTSVRYGLDAYWRALAVHRRVWLG